ncbi:MAG: hypothetical protein WA943_03260 [Parvibaculum sp.]
MAMAITGTTIAATANIMQTDKRVGGQAVALAATAFGLALLVLAVPRIIAHGSIVPVTFNLALDKADALASVRESYRRALRWQPADAQLHQDFALLSRSLINNAANTDEIEEAGDAFYATVMSGPARGFAWSLLAGFEQSRGQSTGLYADHLRLSALLSPYETSSMVQRATVIVSAWADMPKDLRDLARRDLRRMWLTQGSPRTTLITLYLQLDFAERALVRELAFENLEELKHFDRQLLRAVRG